jgi:hypothetical protein
MSSRPRPGRVKVGVAADPLARLAALQRGSAEKLSLAYAAAVKSNDATAIKQAAHAMLSSQRLNGEWFDVTPELAVAAIAAASYRLKDPIVEIPADKIPTALAIAARRDAQEAAAKRKRRVSPAAVWFWAIFLMSLAIGVGTVLLGGNSLSAGETAFVVGFIGFVGFLCASFVALIARLFTVLVGAR